MNIFRLSLVSCCALVLSACGSASDTAPADTTERAASDTPVRSGNLPVYKESGTIEINYAGKLQKHFTTTNTVPGQPGREVYTASWITISAFGSNDIYISLNSRPTVDPKPDQPTLLIEFTLDAETLKAKSNVPVTVSLNPDGSIASDPVELANAVLTLAPVTRVDERTLSLSGSVTGDMAGKPFTAKFMIPTASDRKSPQ